MWRHHSRPAWQYGWEQDPLPSTCFPDCVRHFWKFRRESQDILAPTRNATSSPWSNEDFLNPDDHNRTTPATRIHAVACLCAGHPFLHLSEVNPRQIDPSRVRRSEPGKSHHSRGCDRSRSRLMRSARCTSYRRSASSPKMNAITITTTRIDCSAATAAERRG